MANKSELFLFSWGANSHGQLAIGVESEQEVTPQRVDLSFLEGKPVQIGGGGGHTLILDANGQVYACGWNSRGQLGVGDEKNRCMFTKLPQDAFLEKKIKSLACGWDTSAAVTSDGELFMWGSNQFAQFGKQEIPHSNVPMLISLPEKVSTVAFSLRHVCILTVDGTLYLSGKSKFIGKTEMGGFMKIAEDKIAKIATGQHHVIYLTTSREIYSRGDNKFNQLSDESLTKFSSETAELKSGWTHSGFLTNSEEVFLWGRNSYGQLGQECEKSIATPTKLELPDKVRELHLGSEHGLCVTKSGEVFTWGWNEHGNCGNGTTDNVYKPVKVELPGRCSLAGVGAGFCFCFL
uniref:RCC1-like domain-containing protein n=1 Tax=Lutzomyia longipalpis TaxID=7200 RepID=A0A1B0CUJ6_LUTLO